MKIIQVNSVYRDGSTGKIVLDIHKELMKNGHESIVCYGRGKKYIEKNVYKVCGEYYSKFNHLLAKIRGVLFGGCNISTFNLIRIIKRENPDVVHLHCLNGYFVNIYMLINWLKKNKIKTVLTLHADFMFTGGCNHVFDCEKWKNKRGCYNCKVWKNETESLFFDRSRKMWKLMNRCLSDYNKDDFSVIAVSPWLQKRAGDSAILKKYNVYSIINGLDTNDIFYYRDVVELRKSLGLKGEKVILYVTPFFDINEGHIKGGEYILKLSRLVESNVKIVVVGDYDIKIEYPENMIMIGKINEQSRLAQYYSLADVTVITSRRETFSMVTAESLCCGTPVVGFKAGAPEQIAITEYSRFVEYGNMEQLEKSIKNKLSISIDKNEISQHAHEKYGRDIMYKKYLQIYKKLCMLKKT